MEDATLTLYNIEKCGFYSGDEFRFATTTEAIEAFEGWARNLASVGESTTYDPTEDDAFLRAFCLDVRRLGRSNARLIVTWNELAHVEDGVQTVAMNSPIGHAEVAVMQLDPMSLPGYPAYFVLDPARNQVLNIRFEQRLNGSRQFQRFIQGYLGGFSDWCIWNNDRSALRGYGNANRLTEGVMPEFSTSLVRTAGDVDYIRTHVDDVRKVVRRANISPVIEEHRSFLASAFGFLGLRPNNRLRADVQFQYEFKTRLDAEKFGQIVAEYEKDPNDPWNDVGFVLRRDAQRVHWISSAIARTRIRIDVGRTADGMINIDQLVAYLSENMREGFQALVLNDQ